MQSPNEQYELKYLSYYSNRYKQTSAIVLKRGMSSVDQYGDWTNGSDRILCKDLHLLPERKKWVS